MKGGDPHSCGTRDVLWAIMPLTKELAVKNEHEYLDYDEEQMVHELVDETGAFYTLIYERDGGITIIWDYEEEE